jgi:hypothetical protein
MLSGFRKIVTLAVCLAIFAGLTHALYKNSSARDLLIPDSETLDKYLKTFLALNLPLQKYASSARWDAWELDCIRLPRGRPDPRGEKLLNNLEFPDPVELKKCGITKVHFHIELLRQGMPFDDQLEHLKKAFFGDEIFWGQRILYSYIQRLMQHNIKVQIDGIEPD